MKQQPDLPVKVLDAPYWRVNIRPEIYRREAIPTLNECFKVVETTKVRLRGWDYPHLSPRNSDRACGTDWIASWSDFMGHKEYWRLYQSGQFVHLFSVREAVEPGWREKLEQDAGSHFGKIDTKNVSGFISMVNFIYTVTEIFEFATRLAQKEVYKGNVFVSIRISGIKDFLLTADWNRAWTNDCFAKEDLLGREWEIPCDMLIANSVGKSLDAILWFFERFGWLDPNAKSIREDQEKFLKRQS